MEKLRIHRLKYRNRGMANRKLRGQQEHHVIFKFDTEEKAKDFIEKVKAWYYGTKTEAQIEAKTTPNEKPETPEVKKPAQKKKTGRPTKKNLQGQKR